MYTRTHAIFWAEQKWCVPMWMLSSREHALISFIPPLSVSLSLSCPESYRSHIHHICWAFGAWHTKTHTYTWETPLSPLFKRKTIGFWWLNAPVAPLSPSSWCHTSCFSMGRFQRADHSSLHHGSTIISAGINTKDNVCGIYNWLLSQVRKWQPLRPALSHRPQRGRVEAAAHKPAFKMIDFDLTHWCVRHRCIESFTRSDKNGIM